jgi:trans-aconitate 2-methyltransferase
VSVQSPDGGDWDAVAYDRLSDPQLGWGTTVLERLALRGDETVLDAGCGSGRVTQKLLERLPGGRVVAFDASSTMLEEARRRLAPAGESGGRDA